MPQRPNTPGAPCWADLMTTDTAKAEAFYGELFGWTASHADEEKYGGYITFTKDGQEVAGAMRNDASSGTPDVWSVYLSSANAAQTADSAVANGGQILMEAMEVPEQGSMAMVQDAGGAAVGVWQPAPGGHHGFGAVAEPGTPNWIELFTRDYAPTVKFYEDVFGWTTDVMSDTDEFRYTTLGKGYDAEAGIMDAGAFLPEGVPPHWSIYWGVEDADAAVAKAEELGGSVVQPADDSSYGRMATLADPTGAVFKIVQPAARQ